MTRAAPLALLALLAACAGGATPPPSRGGALPDAVAGVLDRRCSGCHGVTPAQRARLGEDAARLLRWDVDDDGRLATAAQRAAARAACLDERFVDAQDGADASPLILAPLSPTWAGPRLTHPEVFASPDDPDFATLRAWVATEVTPAPPPPLDPAGRAFAEDVMPVLERKGCLGAACHGPSSFSDLRLDPGIPLYPGRYPRAVLEHNRAAMLGGLEGQARLVTLDGDVAASRQLLKNLPLDQGGIIHKGGNRLLERDDPDYQAIFRWLQLEAERERARTGLDPADRGLVFVRRPRATPERFFEDDAFLPGADLWWRKPDGREINLTRGLHAGGPIDVRTPALDYQGRRVVFALRRAAAEPFNVWELELDTGAARQLTFSTDPRVHWRDPSYAPDPDDPTGADLGKVVVVMVSNASGERARSSPDAVLGEAEGGSPAAIRDDERTERAGTFAGRALRVVRGAGAGARRTITASRPGWLELDAPLPVAPDGSTHYVIDATPRMADSYDLYGMRHAAPGDEARTFAETTRRMSWAAGQVRRPSIRSTGEVFVTALRTGWLGPRPYFHGAIFRVHHDGSDFHTHFGNRSELPILAGNRELVTGLEARIGQDADSWWGGVIAVGDHQLGPALDPRNPIDDADHPLDRGAPAHSQHGFARGWVPVDPAVTAGGVSPGGAYRDVAPLPDGSLIAAYAPGPIDLFDPAAAPDFDLVRLVPAPAFWSADGLRPGGFRRELLVRGPDSELWPVPVRARLKEPFHKPLKHADHVVGERPPGGYPAGTPALLEVYDLPLLAMFFEQTAPFGERHLDAETCAVHGEAVPAWRQIRWARVVGAEPRRAPDDDDDNDNEAGPPRQLVLAEVPLAEDGSFQVLIPPGVPFDVQALSADRLALSTPGRWLYTHPGEKHALSIPRALYTQTCEGCHGSLSGARSTSLGMPDVVSSASRTAAMWDAERGERRPPANVVAPASVGAAAPLAVTAPLAVGFAEDVAPVLARACASCHDGAAPAAGLDLTGDGAHARLSPWIDPGGLSTRSPLVERLLGGELAADGAAPAAPHAPLSDDDRLTLTRWIDLGAPDRRARLPGGTP